MSEKSVIPVDARGRVAPVPAFVCTLREDGIDSAWVHVAGRLDLTTALRLEQTLRRAELVARLVVLDLRELTCTGIAAVHVITYASIRARRRGRRLVLVRGPSAVDRVFALTGATEVVEIVDLDPVEPAIQVLLQLEQEGARRMNLTGFNPSASSRSRSEDCSQGGHR